MSKLKKVIIILSIAVLVAVGIFVACDNVSQTYYNDTEYGDYTIIAIRVTKNCSKIEAVLNYEYMQMGSDDIMLTGEGNISFGSPAPSIYYKGETIHCKIEYPHSRYGDVKLAVTYTGLDGKVTTQTINVKH